MTKLSTGHYFRPDQVFSIETVYTTGNYNAYYWFLKIQSIGGAELKISTGSNSEGKEKAELLEQEVFYLVEEALKRE